MTIDEAIEELKALPGPTFIIEGERAFQAAQLGIEALKQVKERRTHDPDFLFEKLPGETKPITGNTAGFKPLHSEIFDKGEK